MKEVKLTNAGSGNFKYSKTDVLKIVNELTILHLQKKYGCIGATFDISYNANNDIVVKNVVMKVNDNWNRWDLC